MTSPGRQLDAAPVGATATGLISSVDFAAGQLVAQRYRIVRLLGMGGMGVVYQARDIELDVDVALKLLRPEFASRADAFERFRQELLLARQVSSPHVVRIHDLVKHGEVWLISMDYVDGQSLERLLDHDGALAPDRALKVARQVALGLAAAHHRQVVHRDLKPANILLHANGDAVITDFGVARSAGGTGITGSGVIIGTPEYLSPEQARADAIDGRSDLYALGLILCEMLTGTLPFRGGTPAEMLAQRIVRDPPSVARLKPGLPPFVVRLCDRLLELKPSRRFQTAEQVVRAIDEKRVPGFDARQRRNGVVIAALVAVALAAGAAWRWQPWTWIGPPSAPVATLLDLAPLPFVTDSDAETAQFAAGVARRLADGLVATSGLEVADAVRVQRALAELDYDAATAGRHLPRVAEAIGARRLLLGELHRADDGYHIALTLRDPGDGPPRWTRTVSATSADQVPTRLAALHAELLGALGVQAATAAPWPSVDALRAAGRLVRAAPATDALDDVVRTASGANDTTLWSLLLGALDREGRTADANTVARRILDAGPRPDRAGRRLLAFCNIVLGRADEAATSLQDLHAAAPTDEATARLLARARADLGEFDAASTLLGPVVDADPRDVDAWYALGKYAIQAGDAKRAVDDYLVRAQVLANRLDDARMRADVANALGVGYRRLGRPELAAQQLEIAERMRGALGDLRGQATTLRNLATVHSIQGDFAAARAALARARAIIEPLADPGASADLDNDEGLLEEEQGNYDRALDAYRRALNLRLAAGDPQLVGESQVNVGFIYYQIGEFDNAQAYSEQAAAAYAKVDDRAGAVHAQQNLGMILVARGDWSGARKLQQAALRSAEELQMAEEATISHAALADLDALEGDAAGALAQSAIAEADFVKRSDVRGIAEMRLLRAGVYIDAGDFTQAASALASLSANDVPNGEQASLGDTRRGEIALGEGDPAGAVAAADAAIARAGQAHALPAELAARLLRARALAARARAGDAKAEIALARRGIARYASVPLRLHLAEAALETGDADPATTWREARTLLARLPAYARSWRIHALAARQLAAPAANEARELATQSAAAREARLPEGLRAAFGRQVAKLDLPAAAAR